MGHKVDPEMDVEVPGVGKVPHAELWDVLKSIADKEHWKMPIDAVIPRPANDRDFAVLDYAIVFFTGSVGAYYDVPGDRTKIRVMAEGYYNAVGA